ncbi:hypothetical protein B0H17DRAFT_1109477 [Mycena rosella]|uniref:HECT-type E3 ubiquitin transferase n=1 Tax=Mycena rosella TaxID=1033263 RepID=A0AAD7BT17_MYCRO|nr:hypothetical protein B0H17DRAFT_1109477 [Mycena rosella]
MSTTSARTPSTTGCSKMQRTLPLWALPLFSRNQAYRRQVVRTFDQKACRALLHFVTSCNRAPLMGFKHLSPAFTIQDMGDTEEHLPGSAACNNILLLPRYKDEGILKNKLLAVIMPESGF